MHLTPPRRSRNRLVIAFAGCAAILVVGGTAIVDAARHFGPMAAVSRHAQAAADVMTRVRGPVPTRDVAADVVGTSGDTTIDALRATGTTWGGTVDLRMTVSDQRGFLGSTRTATRCFRYRFGLPRPSSWGEPIATTCGARKPIDVASPDLTGPAGVTDAVRRRIVTAVATLTAAQRQSPDAVGSVVAAATGPSFTIEPGRSGTATITWVRYGDTCLSVQTTVAGTQVSNPIEGDDCFGG